MRKQDLVNLVSSNGFVDSVKDVNIVIAPDPSMTSFAWKQLSLIVSQECQIEINGNSDNPSTITLVPSIAFEIDNLFINSLKFKDNGVPYYYIAGY